MLNRLISRRRLQNTLKFTGLLLVVIFYFSFLFRESLNAIEHKRERSSMGNVGGGGGIGSAVAAGALGLSLMDAAKSRSSDSEKVVGSHKNQNHHNNHHFYNNTSNIAAISGKAITIPAPAITAITTTTLNPVYEYSEEIHSATERDLSLRRDHLNSVCQHYNLQTVYPPDPWEFLISPGHQLVWCNVFKAASSTWMYYFNILGGYDLQYLQRTEMLPLELARKRFPRPDLTELLENLPSSLSFLFVREPFERLVSAYRNKLEGGRNNYYKVLAKKIIRQFRKGKTVLSAIASMRRRSGPTFKEFLQFLIQQHALKKRFDEHWAPVYSFCTPCSINFTIIGKLETFQRDTEFIIRQAGLEPLLLGKLPRNKLRKIGNQSKGIKTESVVERYFAEIDHNTLDQLLKIYRVDFELFDYDFQKYYAIVEKVPVPTSTVSSTSSQVAITTRTRT